MFVIVEGIDGSGKSTLVANLEKLGCIWLMGENQHDKVDIDNFLVSLKYLRKSKTVFVCDRSFISDLIYRFLDTKECAKYDLNSLYKFCKYCDAIIYCNSANAFKNSMLRGEDNIVTQVISNKLKDYYDFVIDIFERYHITNVIKYDYDVATIDDVIASLKSIRNNINI